MSKVIITCAVTGSIHTPTMSPHLPITPDEIAADGVAAAEAGASILHLHARDPNDGRPTPDPDVFMAFLPRIKQQSDAVINITTGGGLGMTLDERLGRAPAGEPGDDLAQYGFHELRHLPHVEPLQELQVRLGKAPS